MRRLTISALLCVGIISAFAIIAPTKGNAEVNINVAIPLPGLVISAPPAMVVIPGTYAYYPPDVSVNIFFYNGHWYRPYRGQWFIAAGYNGPWGSIAIRNVPGVLLNLPPHYRHVTPGYKRMPHGMVMKNWRTWQDERYGDNYESRRGHGYYYDGEGHEGPHHGRGMGWGMGMHGND